MSVKMPPSDPAVLSRRDAIVDALRSIVPGEGVVAGEREMRPFESDGLTAYRQLPVVVVLLARMGVVSIDKMREYRGYFVVAAFVVAAVITPPDIVSQLALAIPMCLLYEVGILAATLFIKHTQAPDAEAEKPSS